jgi:hypothetical protein
MPKVVAFRKKSEKYSAKSQKNIPCLFADTSRFTIQPMPRSFLALPLLLLNACTSAADHAQAVAARILPTYAAGLDTTSLRTYHVTAADLAEYLDASQPAEDGYLVAYVCEVGSPAHATRFAAFVNMADSLGEFVPQRELGLFADQYGVDYRME